MERNIFEKQRDLNDRLNRYRDEYYNRNAPSVSDEVYDRLFDELKELEQETGIQMANSPTQTVGYPAVSRLEKTRHEIPLLSLDKTKSSMDAIAQACGQVETLQLQERLHIRKTKRIQEELVRVPDFAALYTAPFPLLEPGTGSLLGGVCSAGGAVTSGTDGSGLTVCS